MVKCLAETQIYSFSRKCRRMKQRLQVFQAYKWSYDLWFHDFNNEVFSKSSVIMIIMPLGHTGT